MMDSIHKSSAATYLYKLSLIIMIGVLLLVLPLTWSLWHIQFQAIAILVLWALAWLSVMIARLRYIETNQQGLVIKTINGLQEQVDYKNIVWAFQTVFIRPALISIKYRSKVTGKFKQVLFMPSIQKNDANFLEESKAMKFIREQMIDSNPSSLSVKPSRWKPVGLLLLSGLLAFLLMNII